MATLVILLGPTGAGKSVQAERLAERHGWTHISTGQLIRQDNDPWVMAEVKAGHLAPKDYVDQLLTRALQSHHGSGIILDGYPRELEEADWLDGQLSRFNLELKRAIYVNISRDESVGRDLKRGRQDDSQQSLEQKWDYFEAQVKPVIEHYKQQGVLTEVDGTGAVEEITARIESAL